MSEDDYDPDSDARSEALQFVLRRTAIWAIPLTLAGVLLTALGIPMWISIVAMVIMLIILVFEIDI